ARDAEQIHRLVDDQQGQRRVEATRYADDHLRLAELLQPAGQAGHLGLEDLLAAFAQPLFVLRDERIRVDLPAQHATFLPHLSGQVRRRPQLETAAPERPRQAGVEWTEAETVGPDAVGPQAVQIDVGSQQGPLALEAARLAQKIA